MKDKPQVADFINFFLTNVNEEIGAVGYFPARTSPQASAKTWLEPPVVAGRCEHRRERRTGVECEAALPEAGIAASPCLPTKPLMPGE